MKNCIISIAVFVTVCLVFSGCRDRIRTTPFIPGQEVVEAPGEGGVVKILCPGISVSSDVEILPEHMWVHDFDHSVTDTISFIVDPNDEESARTSNVEITTLASQEKYYFRVDQPVDTIPDFSITINDVTETSIAFSIRPKDPAMTYIYMFTEKSYWDTFGSDEEWYQDDMAYFRDQATGSGLSIQQYLERILKTGNYDAGYVDNLLPGTDYILYVYGLTPQGNRLTGISYDSTATLTAEKIDMFFDITLEINGPMVNMSVNPSDDNQAYYFGVFDKKDASSPEEIIKRCEKNFNDMIAFYGNQSGLTPEEVMAQISSYGIDSYLFELEQTHDYVAFAAAVDMRGLVVSEPCVKEFSTGEVVPSENIISVEICDVTSRTANYNITVTNEDQYVFLLDLATEWKGLTDEEILQCLVSSYDLSNNVRFGNDSGVMTGLSSDTEYVTFAFGYVAGVPTTGLVKNNFTTREATISDAAVDLNYEGYFDGREVEEAYPDIFSGASGYAVLKLEAVPEPDGASFYYNIFAGDLSSETDITDEVLIDELMFQGIKDEPYSWFVIPFGESSTAVGVAVDASGEFGHVARVLIAPEKTDVLPIEDMKLNSTTNIDITYEKVTHAYMRDGNAGHAIRMQ